MMYHISQYVYNTLQYIYTSIVGEVYETLYMHDILQASGEVESMLIIACEPYCSGQ
jgi:hypothetical protein